MKRSEKLKLNPQIVRFITKRKRFSYIAKYFVFYEIRCLFCGHISIKKRCDAKYCKRSHAVLFNRKKNFS